MKHASNASTAGRTHPHRVVAQLTSVHPADDTRIRSRTCRSLIEAGYDVHLFAPDAAPTVRNEPDGVRLHGIRRIRGRLGRMLITVPRVVAAAMTVRPRVFHFHDPELIPAGLLLRLLGRRVVYDAHEELPLQVRNKSWIPRPFRRLVAAGVGFFERMAARCFNAVIAAAPCIAKRLPPRRTVTVQNFPRLEEFDAAEPTPYTERAPILAYVGAVAAVRGASEMVRAVGRLPRERGATLVLAGQVNPPALRSELEALPGWDRTEALGRQSREQVARLLARARIGLVVLHPCENYVDNYATKMFEYMAAGIPIIASDFPLWRRIVEEAGCGLLVDPLDLDAIAAAADHLLTNAEDALALGRNGRRAAEERYNWGPQSRKLLELYEGLLR